MLSFIVGRLREYVLVLFFVASLVFFFVRLAPGSPFAAEKAVSEEVMFALKDRYHLNDPLWVQYKYYLWDLARLDLGPTMKYPGRTVNEMIAAGLPYSAELGFYALLFALVVGLISGVFAALRPNTIGDYLPMSLAMVGVCLPSFLLGPVMILFFCLWLGWFPVSGWDSWDAKILPSITLGAGYAAYIARLARGGMLEILSQDFIRTARAKGLSEGWVVVRHGLKGGLIPVLSFLGPAFAGILVGSFVVESVFRIPGIGRFFVQSAFNRDYFMIGGMTLLYCGMLLISNFSSEVLQAWFNPRLRGQRT